MGVLLLLVVCPATMGCLKRGDTTSSLRSGSQAASTPTLAPAPTPRACAAEKDPKVFVTSVIQDLASRQPTSDEIALADKNFSPENFVDSILISPIFDDAITRFIGNLFRLNDITPVSKNNKEAAAEAALIADLKQEPVIFALRNKDRPWKTLFTSQDIYCTENTAKLYDFPLINTPGFVACRLPPERAGFLGMVSVLRAMSPTANPQAFYRPNNNYHRAAATVYFTTGIQMQANTNGPKGEGEIVPMADCAPTDDMREAKGGLVHGAAAIPLVGQACSACHSPHMGPVSVAFRRFGTVGELLKLKDVETIAAEPSNATSIGDLKAILSNNRSCWSPDGKAPPSEFFGEPGLGKVIAASTTLGHALGVQLPQHLSNRKPTEGMISDVERNYKAQGETLRAAMRGYLLSPDYRCDRVL